MLNLYSHLRSIFENSRIRLSFANVVLPRHSLAYQRCTALRIIEPLAREARDMSTSKGSDFTAREAQFHISTGAHKPRQSVNLDEGQLTAAIHTLEKLSLCHHYRPAVGDLIRLEEYLPFVGVTGVRGFYFAVLAEKMGLVEKPPDPSAFNLLSVAEHGEIPVIERVFETNGTEQAADILPYRRSACQFQVPLLP